MQKKNDLQGKERINLIKAIAIDISIVLSAFIVSTGICYLLQYFKVDVLNYIIIYILGILLTAVFTKGYIYSALLSVVSVLATISFLRCRNTPFILMIRCTWSRLF